MARLTLERAIEPCRLGLTAEDWDAVRQNLDAPHEVCQGVFDLFKIRTRLYSPIAFKWAVPMGIWMNQS